MTVAIESELDVDRSGATAVTATIVDRDSRRFLWICIAPVILFLIFISIIPFVVVLIDSMRQMNLSAILDRGTFVGLTNFMTALSSGSEIGGGTEIYEAALLTAMFVVIVVPIEFVLGLLLALVLNRDFLGRRIWVTILLLPTMMAPVAAGMIWQFLFMPNFGLLSYTLKKIGLFAKTPIFSDPATAWLGLAVVDVWEWTPFMMLLMLAGLFAMPREPLEAAEIDGASRWQMFWHIQLPLLRPMIVLALLFRTIDASKVFDIIWVLTKGGPGKSTEVISVYAYRLSFVQWDLGTGAAVGLIVAFFSILIAATFYKIVTQYAASGSVP
jgi:multiple sugar transport system permease protein